MAKRTKGLSKAALSKLAPAPEDKVFWSNRGKPEMATSFGLVPSKAPTLPPMEQDIAESINAVLASVASGESFPIAPEVITEFGVSVARKLQKALTAKTDKRKPYTLRMSEVGQPCLRRLWYAVNEPEDAEEHSPATLVRFLYGDILEDVVLALAKVAGNTVEGQQEELSFTITAASGRVWTILGHRDALINGKEWDVKSTSGYGANKFKEGLTVDNDSFGYISQLRCYATASHHPPGGFLVINKENGEVFTSPYPAGDDYTRLIVTTVSVVDDVTTLPDRQYTEQDDAYNGNRTLPTPCSYCPYKWKCWQDANEGTGLRMFKYSNKVVYLTKVVKEPRVEEIKPWLE